MNHRWLRTVGAVYLRRHVGKNLGTLEGLGNVPREGGFVLVPNHTSYLDHFVLDFLLEAVRDEPTWFLTKKESFEKPLVRAWTRAWHGIPVDRDRPSADTLRTVQHVLQAGAALCVYPEGTRNPEPEKLLEFKAGAFHFAATSNVPVIPVALVGTDQVLPRGGRRFRPGRIDVRFGAPIVPDTSRPKPERVRETLDAARTWMEDALMQMRSDRGQDIVDANGLTARTSELTNRGQLTGRRTRALAFVIRSLERSHPGNVGPIKALARLRGLRALSMSGPLRTLLLGRAERGLRHALRVSPSDADTHYYLGSALASRHRCDVDAVRHLEAAVGLTGEADPRPLLALAQLEARSGDPDNAETLLDAANSALQEDDPRTPARLARIAAVRKELEDAA